MLRRVWGLVLSFIAQIALITLLTGICAAEDEPISCDSKTGVWDFGIEYVAADCVPIPMNDNMPVRYITNALTCNRTSKKVGLLAPYGDSLTSPQALVAFAETMISSDGRHYKIFRNKEGSHFLILHPDYTGSLDGKDMTQFVEGEVKEDIFKRGFILGDIPNCKGGDFDSDPKTEPCIMSSVNIGTGRLSHWQELFNLKNNRSLSLGVDLYYRSMPFTPSSIGNGWSHTYEETLLPGSGYSMVYWSEGKRRIYSKRKETDSSYSSPLGDRSTLAKTESGWTITELNGVKRTFDNSGRLLSITDRYLQNALELTYSNGKLSAVTDSTGRAILFGYNAQTGNLESITNPNQNTFALGYSGNLLASVTLPGDNLKWLYTYGTNGLLETKTDPAHNIIRYGYDADNRLSSATDPLGRMLQFSRPPQTLPPGCFAGGTGAPGKIPDVYGVARPGCPAPMVFNLLDKDLNSKTFAYDTLTMSVRTETDPLGNVTNYYYNADGTMRAKIVPFDGAVRLTSFFTYDNFGNVVTETEPADISVYTPTIDPQTADIPALALLTPPIKTAFSYTYDSANYNQIKTMTDNRGSVPLTTIYDRYLEPDGNGENLLVTKMTVPGGSAGVLLVSYLRQNPNGTLGSFTDASGQRTSFTYFPVDTSVNSGLLHETVMPDGLKLSNTAYDRNGNVLETKIVDRNGNAVPTKTTQGYSALNQIMSKLKQSTFQPAAFPQNLTQYGYDNNGNLSSVTDAENRTTSYKYTYQGQLAEITDARQKLTKLEYGTASCPSCANGVDKLTAVRDANHVANNQPGTLYTYDKAGRLETETDPVGKKIRYTYFDSGLVKEKIDATNPIAEKTLIRYRYNSRGQLTDKIYSDNNSVHFDYDSNGRLTNANNLTGAVTTFGYTIDYHDNGRLKSVTDTSGKKISYDEYDGNGRRKKVTYLSGSPEQWVLNYDYEGDHLQHIYAPAGTFSFSYDAGGRRNRLIYPNGTQADYGYDDLGQINSLTHNVTGGGTIVTNGYPEYDKAGNLKKRTGDYPGSYLYDELYRLKEASGPAGTEKYDYDDVGNRTKGPSPKDTKYSYDQANRMIMGRLFQHDYDNNGNQLTRTVPETTVNGWAHTWNHENQLVKAEQVKGGVRRTITFTYDSFGRRIVKKLVAVQGGLPKTTTWNYLYDEEDIVNEMVNDEVTTTVMRYTHGPGVDEPLALERSGRAYFYHADGLGSITTITDTAGNVVQGYGYDSFGNVTPQTGFANSYTYTGREWDKETGLYYYRARYYDPMIGRFISKDPIGFKAGDTNLYGYVKENPVNYTDPTGLYQMCTRDLLLPIPYARHCYAKFQDGSTSSYDPDGVGPDSDPNQKGTVCTERQDTDKDPCIKKAMDKCLGKNYHFTKFNCCHCVEQALKECGTSVPADSWPNWPINPGPQPGEPGYSPAPIYGPSQGK